MSQEKQFVRESKSLGLLAIRFVELLKSADVLNLKDASELLDVKQKRRIYDITNVLEGIKLIQKEGKNCVKWKNYAEDANNQFQDEDLQQLLEEKEYLFEEEAALDSQIAIMRKNLKVLAKDPTFKSYSYVTRDDLLEAFGEDQTVLVVKNQHLISVKKEEISVANFLEGFGKDSSDEPSRFMMTLKAKRNCQLDVHLVSDQTSSAHFLEKNMVKEMKSNYDKFNDAKLKIAKSRAKTIIKTEKIDPPIIKKRPHLYPNVSILKRNRAETIVPEVPLTPQELEHRADTLLEHKDYRELSKFQILKDSNLWDDNPGLIPMSHNPDSDYHYSLHPSEGVIDLFDFPDFPVLEEDYDEDELIEEDVENGENEDFLDYEYLEI